MKKLIILFFGILFFANIAQATEAAPLHSSRTTIDNWYLRDFNSDITLNKDNSVTITEKIYADCGSLPNKHGIFRVLPTRMKVDKKYLNTPIKLISISDFQGNAIPFTAIRDNWTHSLTWKIGDPNKTVLGVNEYQIKYVIKNVVRFQNKDFDEFYWNLNGNFWDIETDNFTADIHFPNEISQSNSELSLYAGEYGKNNTSLATSSWLSANTLRIQSKATLAAGQGITISLTFPKNIISKYAPPLNERLPYLFLLLPVIVFLLMYRLWQNIGKDPKTNPTIVPEFAPPQKLSPLEMGMILTNGLFKKDYLSASIVHLAVKKIISLEKIEKKGIFGTEDYWIKLISANYGLADPHEKIILDGMFATKSGDPKVRLSTLQNKFYTQIPKIKESVSDTLKSKQLLDKSGRTYQYIFLFTGLFASGIGFALYNIHPLLTWAVSISGIITTIFSLILPRRTLTGLQTFKQIQGFKMYMETAEKYRQQFFEKEDIFETLLPYAIMFGITSKWIRTTKNLYQQDKGIDYFGTYHPIWFAGSVAHFNVDTFTSSLNHVTHSMASSMSSAPSSSGGSGSGGGGFSGGGGGGGGGGGW